MTGGSAEGVLDRTRPPLLGQPRAVRPLDVTRFTLGGGLGVVARVQPGVPIVNLHVLIGGGSAAVSAGQAGMPSLAASLLDEGTEGRSSLEIAQALEGMGAAFHAGTGFDASELALNVLSARLPAALEVLGDMLLRPTFPERELARLRSERLARLSQELDDARSVANFAFARGIYGAEHPWGSPLLGTPESVAGIERDDVVAFHYEHVHPGNVTLLVVGDVDPERLERLLESALGAWKGASVPSRALAEPPQLAASRVLLVDRPGAPQSEIRVGRLTVARSTEDYFALTVMNTLLGGAFTSRLNQNLREERGYTYGAGSGFSMRTEPGPWLAHVAVHTPVTPDAVAQTLEEVRRVSEENVTADELDRARRYLALRLPQRFETAAGVTAALAEIELHGLPQDYFTTYVDRITDVSAQDVRAAAERHLGAGPWLTVVVGDRAAVEEGLRALGAGPVEILTGPWDPAPAGSDTPRGEGVAGC